MAESQVFKILAIDDSPEIISVIRSAVSSDYTLLAATSGVKGLEIARSQAVDMILLDVMMPEMDGFEVLAALKQDAALRDVPVIFVTGKNSTGDEVQGLQMGAVDFVAKPIEPTILKARVNTQVRLAKANRQLETLNKQLEEEREAMLKFIALTQKNARLADEMTQQLSR